MPKVKLRRCKVRWLKADGDPCWRVERALEEMVIQYEVIGESYLEGRRSEVERLTGQRHLPVIEFEDGTVYREDSSKMAARIRAGTLFEGREGG